MATNIKIYVCYLGVYNVICDFGIKIYVILRSKLFISTSPIHILRLQKLHKLGHSEVSMIKAEMRENCLFSSLRHFEEKACLLSQSSAPVGKLACLRFGQEVTGRLSPDSMEYSPASSGESLSLASLRSHWFQMTWEKTQESCTIFKSSPPTFMSETMLETRCSTAEAWAL